jgi:hypothetical protein
VSKGYPYLGHPLDIELFDHVDGTATDELHARVEAHLVECSLCRMKLSRLRQDDEDDEELGVPNDHNMW